MAKGVKGAEGEGIGGIRKGGMQWGKSVAGSPGKATRRLYGRV